MKLCILLNFMALSIMLLISTSTEASRAVAATSAAVVPSRLKSDSGRCRGNGSASTLLYAKYLRSAAAAAAAAAKGKPTKSKNYHKTCSFG